ncbi:MAG TPA: GlsB/YeaQ/YmgE family stress response membrane protein [Gemmatimonadales bacterium]|nr:GlsB/YeaQ/YmgE family stress response membrane protein [Gemmatimonadales bacterium]
MHLIVTLIIGGVVGWLASILMKTNVQMGVLANIVVGIVGSLLGYWIAGLIGLSANGVIASWLIAVAGAVVLIAILKGMKVLK